MASLGETTLRHPKLYPWSQRSLKEPVDGLVVGVGVENSNVSTPIYSRPTSIVCGCLSGSLLGLADGDVRRYGELLNCAPD